jgi:S1-C subfamily serine protease
MLPNHAPLMVAERFKVLEALFPGRIAAKQDFAGYWEYLLEEAIFTFPAHPNWGGTALISSQGDLIGIGSLQIERVREGQGGGKAKSENLNMTIPIDLLKPILDDLTKYGRVNKPVRPWLGIYATEAEDRVVAVGVAAKGPAARAEIRAGDMIVAVTGENVSNLAAFYRRVWALGDAGVEVPLTLHRDGVTFDVRVNSSDRAKFLKGPRMH